MAVSATRSATLAATTTPDTITLAGPGQGVIVTNMDGAGFVCFRVDGTTAAAAPSAENVLIGKAGGGSKRISHSKWPVVISVYASAATVVGAEVY